MIASSALAAASAPDWLCRYSGQRISTASIWDDAVWTLDIRIPTEHKRTVRWDYALPNRTLLSDPQNEPLRSVAKAILYELLSGGFGETRPVKHSSLIGFATVLTRLVRWMVVHRITGFDQFTVEHLRTYRQFVGRIKERPKNGAPFESRPTKNRTLSLTLTPLRILLSASHRIPLQPQGDPLELLDLLKVGQAEKDTHTDRIPDAVAGPLLEKAFSMIRDYGSRLVEQYGVMDREFQATGHLSPGWRAKNAHTGRREFAQTQTPLVVSLRDGDAVDVSTIDGWQFRTLIRHLEIACFIVLAGMVGMRVSEIGSVKRGCLSVSVLTDGRRLLLLRAVIHKTSKEPAGTPRDWAAGWDSPGNPVRSAIATLEALRAIDTPHTDYLFVSSRNRNTREQKTVIRQIHNERLNDFAAFVGIAGWRLRTHQFRKTFARFVTKRDYTGLLALKNHFGHLAIQMTEVYGSWDDDLVTELLDAEIEHDYEALDQILSSDRLAGKLGERIATRNKRFRGLAGAAARAEYIDNIKSDPSSDRLSLVRHEYGFCVLEAESAACGLDAWRVGPPTCAPCKNLVVSEAHAHYWQRIRETLNDDLRRVAVDSPHAADLRSAEQSVTTLLSGLTK